MGMLDCTGGGMVLYSHGTYPLEHGQLEGGYLEFRVSTGDHVLLRRFVSSSHPEPQSMCVSVHRDVMEE